MNYAPVLVPTLCRVSHFRNCINSLLKCQFSNKTDLFIALDFPAEEKHWEGYKQIIDFINEIDGFKSVNVIKREQNYGSFKNIHSACTLLFKDYRSLILIEDDNFFSEDFLNFMNRSLDKFEYDSKIFSVCGYNYPVIMPNNYNKNVYIWQGHSGWGEAYWRDKYLRVDWSENGYFENIEVFLRKYKVVIKFNKIANNYLPALLHARNARLLHGDIYICMHQYLNKMYSIFPSESRVRNLGNDGSGENCSKLNNDIFSNQKIYFGSSRYVIDDYIAEDYQINLILKKYFQKSLINKIVSYFKLFLINIRWYDRLRILRSKLNG